MKSITIHGVEKDLDIRISEKSKEYGLSQNKTVKYILQKALCVDPAAASKKEMFMDLFGVWSEAERKDFEGKIQDLETVNEADWVK